MQVLRLGAIPFAMQTGYIRLSAITYQSFGVDKNKALRKRSALFFGAGNGTRTHDLRITNALLYQLSYSSIKSDKPDFVILTYLS